MIFFKFMFVLTFGLLMLDAKSNVDLPFKFKFLVLYSENNLELELLRVL